MPITRDFLDILDAATIEANKALGVSPSAPNGALAFDPADATPDLHDAAVHTLRAVEALQNWAHEVTRELKAAGVEVLSE